MSRCVQCGDVATHAVAYDRSITLCGDDFCAQGWHRAKLQQLMREHVDKTYDVAMAVLHAQPNAADALERLNQNQRDIGLHLEGRSGSETERLLLEHIAIAGNILGLLAAGNPDIDGDIAEWRRNGREISDHVVKLTGLPRDAVRKMFSDHLDQTLVYVTLIDENAQTRRIEAAVTVARLHMVRIGDAISEALCKAN